MEASDSVLFPIKKDGYLYRLYIDEVGNHDLMASENDNERFLTLFGVSISYFELVNVVQPEMQDIKLHYFQKDPDKPIVLHRKEITRYQGDFRVLFDPQIRKDFGNRMLRAYKEWNYTAFTVTLDKREHLRKYSIWHYAPYHYCFEVLVERYVLFLHYRGLRGDVLVESRANQPDENLKNSFRRFYERGTHNLPAHIIQKSLTSSELKLKKKKENICGLQLADLLAHPAQYDLLFRYGLIQQHLSEYGREVAKILNELKYNRDRKSGKVEGYGIKLLP